MVNNTWKVTTITINMRKRNTMTVFNNQQIKSNQIMETVWKHHHTWPKKDTIITSFTFWNISFLMQNGTQINAVNKNNFRKTSKVIILFNWRVSLLVILAVKIFFVWHIWRLWFQILFWNYLNFKLYMQIILPFNYTKIVFEKFWSTPVEHFFLNTYAKKYLSVTK